MEGEKRSQGLSIVVCTHPLASIEMAVASMMRLSVLGDPM